MLFNHSTIVFFYFLFSIVVESVMAPTIQATKQPSFKSYQYWALTICYVCFFVLVPGVYYVGFKLLCSTLFCNIHWKLFFYLLPSFFSVLQKKNGKIVYGSCVCKVKNYIFFTLELKRIKTSKNSRTTISKKYMD